MTFGAVAGSQRRSAAVTPANVIANGTFADATGWSNIGFSGKSVTGGKLVFASTPAYDPALYNCTLVVGKYYELTYTISGYSSGQPAPILYPQPPYGTVRTANGTYTERLLVDSGTAALGFLTIDVTGTFSIDDVTLVGPYNTATVGGA